MQIVVSETAAGWVVKDGETMGPFSKQRAMDLAEGMAVAIRKHTDRTVEVVVLAATQANSPSHQ